MATKVSGRSNTAAANLNALAEAHDFATETPRCNITLDAALVLQAAFSGLDQPTLAFVLDVIQCDLQAQRAAGITWEDIPEPQPGQKVYVKTLVGGARRYGYQEVDPSLRPVEYTRCRDVESERDCDGWRWLYKGSSKGNPT